MLRQLTAMVAYRQVALRVLLIVVVVLFLRLLLFC